MSKKPAARQGDLDRRRDKLLTVKEYSHLTREHEGSVYRRVREGRQPGVHRFGSNIRIDAPDEDDDD